MPYSRPQPRRARSLASASVIITAALAVSLIGQGSPASSTVVQPGDTLESVSAAGSHRLPTGDAVFLARPSGGQTTLGRNIKWGSDAGSKRKECHQTRPICVHWATSGVDAPPATDTDTDTVPDRVEQVLAAAGASWTRIVNQLGFKAPRSDATSRNKGGSDDLDIYLADTGARDLSGYTSSDDPRLSDASTYKYRDVSAFIVVDNDFTNEQFPQGTPLGNLQATVAHEFFHAVQLAYDYREDPWLAEGSATWAEDTVFDDVNLNRVYLQHSQLADPLTPLDFGRARHQYGAWLFLRYLAERFGPQFIARVWRFADDSAAQVSAKELKTYSTAAVSKALAREGRSMRSVYADFVRVNLHPGRYYEEGASYFSPYVPRWTLNRRGDDTGWAGLTLDHLSSFYVAFTPGANAPPGRRLSVRIDGPAKWAGPEARVVVRYKSGKLSTLKVRLNRRGNGEVRVNFARNEVAAVEVALINASTRYRDCFSRGTTLSCRGVSKDDNRSYKVRARVL